MIKRLLIVCASAAVISMVCFTFLGVMGGFPDGFNNGPWGNGNWNWGRGPRDTGPTVTRSLPYSGSSRLEVAYPADITYTQGDQPSFSITGPQNVIDDLQLNDGVLESSHGPGRHYRWGGPWGRRDNGGRLTITVVGPSTHEFHLAGAEKLIIRNFDQESLVLHIAGAADVDGQGKAKRLEAHIAGAEHERGIGNIVNRTVRPYAAREAWRKAFDQLMAEVDAFGPDLILVSAGFDAHARDPLAQQQLEDDDFAWATRAITSGARARCGGKVVSSLEGGYDLEALGRSALAHVRALQAH